MNRSKVGISEDAGGPASLNMEDLKVERVACTFCHAYPFLESSLSLFSPSVCTGMNRPAAGINERKDAFPVASRSYSQ
jgi:hypothetical protein